MRQPPSVEQKDRSQIKARQMVWVYDDTRMNEITALLKPGIAPG
jgi:hypothetical protein